MRLRVAALSLLLTLLAACAPQAGRIASTPALGPPAPRPEVDWAFEASDVPVDPAYRFGKLANGMRYVIRQNATPAGTAVVRMAVRAGSLDEEDSELGFAHFVEHMAFNGSTNVPEGEMVKLLERNGLAFGADTNASTGFEATVYKLDLPQNDAKLLDVALMLMRETASELTFSPAAVERERGVVLSELRDRSNFELNNALGDTKFLHPGARYPRRFPIGDRQLLEGASAAALKTFWAREYVPEHTVLVVVGDFDVDQIEAKIAASFASWRQRPAEPQPGGGPVRHDDASRAEAYVDPALSERVTVSRHGPWLDEPDTIAQRQEGLLRSIGYDIVNRRLQRLSREANPKFRSAGFGTGPVFREGRSTRLVVDTADAKWRRGLEAAALEYRRALEFGFTQGEITEQLANIRSALENSAASAATRSNNALVQAAFDLIDDDIVPAEPALVLARFEAFAPRIDAAAILAALKREAIALDDPLIRFRGRVAPKGGEKALRAAWNKAMRKSLSRGSEAETQAFAYADFGKPGAVTSDSTMAPLGIRTLRFANGVMLNLKPTGLDKDRVELRLSIDGGKMLDTRENPLATDLMPYFDEGGLKAHSEDELETILAGKTVQANFAAAEDTFVASARTTPRDLELQLQLLAGFVTDPGYRSEGLTKYRHQINNFFKQMRSTPGIALSSAVGAIVSDNDPRFSLSDIADYRKLTFEDLGNAISDRLARGAIEIGVVGDVVPDQAIAAVAHTFGALGPRESAFGDHPGQPPRSFTADRSRRVIRHDGPKDQAMLQLAWPTRDDSDATEALALELLERVLRIELTDTLREALGKAYSPGASSNLSHAWKGYGTFIISASLDVADIAATRDALRTMLKELRSSPVTADVLQRARQPMLEDYENLFKSNRGWLSLVDRAQSEADRIDRVTKAKERLLAMTPETLRELAQRYLDPDQALELLVLPEGATVP